MVKRTAAVMLTAFLFTSFFTVPALAETREKKRERRRNEHQPPKRTACIAHRGASGHAPENTMAAFRKAIGMKADYIEIDVQMAKDGELVVIHDTTVNRTTNGSGKISDLTYSEIRALDAGGWYSRSFKGEQVPSFDAFLDEFGGKAGLLIELKAPERYPGIEEKVAEALRKRGLDSGPSVVIQSFNHSSVQRSKSLLPALAHGVLTGNKGRHVTDEQLADFAEYADFYNTDQTAMSADLALRIHSASMKTFVYTVRAQSEANRLLAMHVDGIITDYPEYVPPSGQE